MTTTAIILAAGEGSRFGGKIPKQFQRLNGRRVIDYSVETLVSHPAIDDVVIVCSPAWRSTCEAFEGYRTSIGGETRIASSLAGLRACPPSTKRVLIHDAARPMVTHAVIDRCLAALDSWDAVDTCIPTADTIVAVEGEQIVSIPSRKNLRRGQTPQAFRYERILNAHRQFASQIDATITEETITDDIGIALRAGLRCGWVLGDETNDKITTPLDLIRLERMQGHSVAKIEPSHQPISFRNQNILVTGGRGTVGSAIVRLLHEQGAIVTPIGSREWNLETQTSAPGFLRETTWHHIIHCAGVMSTCTDASDFDRVFHINTRSLLAIVDLAKQTMPPGGTILVLSSSSATHGRSRFPLYSASKAALENLVQSYAELLKPHQIHLTCLSPSRINSPMLTTIAVDAAEALDSEYVSHAAIDALGSRIDATIHHTRISNIETQRFQTCT